MNAKDSLKKFGKKITPAYLTKVAVLTGIAFILYMFAKFPLPFLFPSFLEMQFSELPAILAGFALGPFAGAVVTILRVVLKFHTNTAFVGEVTDIILGLAYVLPASIIYSFNKSKKGALLGLICGTVLSTVAAMFLNRFLSIPFYVTLYFHGNFDTIVGICSALYPSITRDNFYAIYLFAGVLPFNILRLGLVSLITFLVYKKLSKILHWEIPKKKEPTLQDNSDVAEKEDAPIEESATSKEDSEEDAFSDDTSTKL